MSDRVKKKNLEVNCNNSDKRVESLCLCSVRIWETGEEIRLFCVVSHFVVGSELQENSVLNCRMLFLSFLLFDQFHYDVEW